MTPRENPKIKGDEASLRGLHRLQARVETVTRAVARPSGLRSRYRIVPTAARREQAIRVARAPRTFFVLVDGRGVAEDGLDDLPGRDHAVLAREQIRIALHGITDQAFVSAHLGRGLSGQVELDVVARHRFTRTLRARADGDREVRAQAKAHVVGALGQRLRKYLMRRTVKFHEHLGRSDRQILTRADVEGHAGPTPGVDVQTQ